MASERPVVEVRVIAETHGLEYITTQQGSEESVRWDATRQKKGVGHDE